MTAPNDREFLEAYRIPTRCTDLPLKDAMTKCAVQTRVISTSAPAFGMSSSAHSCRNN